MNRLYIFWYVPMLIAFVAGIVSVACGPAHAQWPGQEQTPKIGSEGWPTTNGDTESGGTHGRPGAHNLLCAFDYLRAARAVNHFRIGRSGRPICPAGGTNYGSYFSDDRRKALEKLIAQAGVRRDRVVAVEKPGFHNAAAVLCEGGNGEMKRLIIWDPQFLGDLDRKAGTRWASVAILAHEIAHHLNLDTGQQRRPTPRESKEQELYADRYAGARLRGLGAARRDAVAVFRFMGAGGATHPPWQRRVEEAGRGWDLARSGGTEPGGGTTGPGGDRRSRYDRPGQRDSYRKPPPPRMAAFCVTPAGHCRMGMRVPVGARCICYSRFGVFPGVGR